MMASLSMARLEPAISINKAVRQSTRTQLHIALPLVEGSGGKGEIEDPGRSTGWQPFGMLVRMAAQANLLSESPAPPSAELPLAIGRELESPVLKRDFTISQNE
jgi:hypothetical protein